MYFALKFIISLHVFILNLLLTAIIRILLFYFKEYSMSIQSVLEHMNNHHQAELKGLAAHYSGNKSITDAKLVGVDTKGMDIEYNGSTKLRVDFLKEYTTSTLKEAIIEVCQTIAPKDTGNIKQEIDEFMKTLGSVIIASVDKNGQVISSYAPVIHCNNKLYIYISEVADHYSGISANPKNIEILFIEDEQAAKTIIARKRLKYKVEAHFIERESTEFEQALNQFEKDRSDMGITTIRNMKDFHLVALERKEGRFVKGFGAAYDITKDGEVQHVRGGTGHKMHK